VPQKPCLFVSSKRKIALRAKVACQTADQTDIREKTSPEALSLEVLRVQNRKTIDRSHEKGSAVGQSLEPVRFDISEKTWELERIAKLAQKVTELRATRVRQIKQSLVKGEYQVDAQEVARSIIRTEMSRYREKAMNVEPKELSILYEEKIWRAMRSRAV
jgi:flagellar biosynthesis anti-sigma factor FlgM